MLRNTLRGVAFAAAATLVLTLSGPAAFAAAVTIASTSSVPAQRVPARPT